MWQKSNKILFRETDAPLLVLVPTTQPVWKRQPLPPRQRPQRLRQRPQQRQVQGELLQMQEVHCCIMLIQRILFWFSLKPNLIPRLSKISHIHVFTSGDASATDAPADDSATTVAAEDPTTTTTTTAAPGYALCFSSLLSLLVCLPGCFLSQKLFQLGKRDKQQQRQPPQQPQPPQSPSLTAMLRSL